jgi:hypothetical protein
MVKRAHHLLYSNRFFGLCSYYRRFVKGFSQLGAPLTDLTKKGAFHWTKESQQTFNKMKEVMSTCPVLSLLDFSQSFVLECDASGVGIGVVLMQGGHPIVFKSRKLNESETPYPIYDKEMLAIMHALTKFMKYLVGNKFVVKTDHNNLKYFLDQKDLSKKQQKWVSKIQAFYLDIEYVKGKRNIVANALSRRPTGCSMMDICTDWKAHLLLEYSKNKFACEVMDGQVVDERYRVLDDIIFYKALIYLVPESTLKGKILKVCHDHFYGFHYRASSSARQGLYICGGRQTDQICTFLFHTHRLHGHTGSKVVFQGGILVAWFTQADSQ